MKHGQITTVGRGANSLVVCDAGIEMCNLRCFLIAQAISASYCNSFKFLIVCTCITKTVYSVKIAADK